MSCNLIQVVSGRKVARPIASEEEYRKLRDSAHQRAVLAAVREKGDKDAKMRLVQFNYSGHYPDGRVKGNKLPSKAFGFDIDDPEAFARVTKVLLAKPEEYGLLMLERSVNNGGHAVFERHAGRTILEEQVRMSTLLECEMDTNAHDVNRVFFATGNTQDDLLYVSEKLFADKYEATAAEAEAKALEMRERDGREELPAGAHNADKHYRPWTTAPAPITDNHEIEFSNPQDLEILDNRSLEASKPQEIDSSNPHSPTLPTEYNGFTYKAIVAKWWELHNNGQTPVRSNRDVLTFELAVNLRHICGFDREVLRNAIPCYDGFPEEQKMKCIDSALSERRTQMPRRLRDVLDALKAERAATADVSDAAVKELKLPQMPQGVRESINAVGSLLAMPALTAICPVLGMLATGVKLVVHGKADHLNLISYVAGNYASGKGSIDPVMEAWTAEVRATDSLYHEQEDVWRAKKRGAKNKKEQPEEPRLPVRCLTLNNTVANLAERLSNTQGKHAFSFTPEADIVAQIWKSTLNDFSVMLRQSYDGTSYEREAKSADAVNVHIDHLLWNVTMCGTPDALYRVVNNYTDGFQSRIAIARTPDNTFLPLADKPAVITDLQREKIAQVAHLLQLMSGTAVLPKLELRGREWLEKIRIETMKNDDYVKARQRFRICVTAQRMTCCVMLCYVAEKLLKKYGMNNAETQLKTNASLCCQMLEKAQTPSMLDTFNVIADSLMDNALYFFRDRIENAFASHDYSGSQREHAGKNDTIYERLGMVFTFEQAMQQTQAMKGPYATRNSVHQMLKNWRQQGLIEQENNEWRKIC